MSDTVVIGVTGILVSGVVGPFVAARLARKATRTAFDRDRAATERDGLRQLFDDAAKLLAGAVGSMRAVRSNPPDSDTYTRSAALLEEVFPMGLRLRLWLPEDHDVILAYDHAREELIAASATADDQATDAHLAAFEGARADFLEASRRLLATPIPDQAAP